jgi:hypothetical protein
VNPSKLRREWIAQHKLFLAGSAWMVFSMQAASFGLQLVALVELIKCNER